MGELPEVVEANLAILTEAGIWHLASQNHPATSCADAAPRRNRLGYVGIPLADELKSWVGADGEGRRVVALHCRGNRQLDLTPSGKVEQVLGFLPERLPEDELARRFAQGYGLVTPFGLAGRHPEVDQVFDLGVVTDQTFAPHTMMTNLGHRNHGVEFDPREMVAKLPNTRTADITVATRAAPRIHTIGILTGNSPESGILLWEWINDRVRRDTPPGSKGDTAFPHVIVESVPEMGLSMQLRDREATVRSVVCDGVRRLCEAGATLVAIACNTTQYFSAEIREICAEYGASFVSIVDETTAVLRRAKVTRFALLAIGHATDLDHYSDFGRLRPEFEVLVPSQRGSERIVELAYRVKEETDSIGAMNQFNDVVKAVAGSHQVDVVLLALTELSIVYANPKRRRLPFEIRDTLEILARAVAERYLAERWAAEGDDDGHPEDVAPALALPEAG